MNALAPIDTKSAVPAADPFASATADEAGLFTNRQVEFLAERGLVFMTDRRLDEIHYGTIIAANYEQAARIARQRGYGEKVTARMGGSFLSNMKRWLRSRR